MKDNTILTPEYGQVFTPSSLARFMTELLGTDIDSDKSILDPCIGPNSFFKALSKNQSKCYLKGIEIDDNLITKSTYDFFRNTKRELIIGSFFDLELSEKFDIIIQNPPYVRHELLQVGLNSKKKIRNVLQNSFQNIPSQSNLYIYFLLKSILHLKEDGILVAVVYDSWLYSNFGKYLKEAFIKIGFLERIYHFKQGVFDDAEVGITIIKFTRRKQKKCVTSYYPLNCIEDIEHDKNEKYPQFILQENLIEHSFNNSSIFKMENNHFIPINKLSNQIVHRGTSAIVNKYFISSSVRLAEHKPFIKNIYSIKTFKIEKGDSFILSVNKTISKETKKYLNFIEHEIQKTPDKIHKSVKRKISSENEWFKIKEQKSGNILFNYYLRNNIDFLYNPGQELSSDNFYCLNIVEDTLAFVAVLNSTFTKLEVLSKSRTQGNGLRKIQLYEFKKVKVFDIRLFSRDSVLQLEALGQKLIKTNRYNNEKKKVIEQIDYILLKIYNKDNNLSLSLYDLKSEYKKYF